MAAKTDRPAAQPAESRRVKLCDEIIDLASRYRHTPTGKLTIRQRSTLVHVRNLLKEHRPRMISPDE